MSLLQCRRGLQGERPRWHSTKQGQLDRSMIRIETSNSAWAGKSVLAFAWLLLLPCLAQAQSQTAPADAVPSVAHPLTAESLAASSDVELTGLTARWAELNPGERRALLAEVRSRMVRSSQPTRPKMSVRVQRKYGRVVRKSDGSVVVETRVVEVRPRADGGRTTFGVGFEQRSRRSAEKPQETPSVDTPPAVTVRQQPSDQP